MNFTEAVAEVNLATKRPDKINVARRKINAAISFYSFDSEFSRDFTEQLVPIDVTEWTQSFALSTLTRFRKFKYIKNAGTKLFLQPLADSELFKECTTRGRYYIAGDNVNLYMPALASQLDVGYFQYPTVLSDLATANSHWMLDMCPYMLIDWAAGEVFKEIGDDKSYREHKTSSRELYLALRRDIGISTQ